MGERIRLSKTITERLKTKLDKAREIKEKDD